MTATAVRAVAYRYTIAGRVKRHPGLAAALAYWRGLQYVYLEPTPELLAQQAAYRVEHEAKIVERMTRGHERPCHHCECNTQRLRPMGEACPVCGFDGYNGLQKIGGPRRLIIVNEETGERVAHYFYDREPESLGFGPRVVKHG